AYTRPSPTIVATASGTTRQGRGTSDPSTAASAKATAEWPDTYPSPVARSRTRTVATTSIGRARDAKCFTALAPQYAPWLATRAEAVSRGLRVTTAVVVTTRSDPTKLPICTGAHTNGHTGSGSWLSAAKIRTSTSGISSVAVTTTQLPASSTAPPMAAATSPVCTSRRVVAGPIRGDATGARR